MWRRKILKELIEWNEVIVKANRNKYTFKNVKKKSERYSE
jgi:hypothetical protein